MGKRLTTQDISEPQEPAAVLHMALLVCRRTGSLAGLNCQVSSSAASEGHGSQSLKAFLF